ncbi:MAG: hypothetical protein NZ480_06770 [Bdellovibrionaceae bacterium]|nr:hypothetical protein [Pseudobdellovibrionaceae bacterium]MDW8190206.1 hypothetical protein [Pseudobdellovibrionaceae bacterium]
MMKHGWVVSKWVIRFVSGLVFIVGISRHGALARVEWEGQYRLEIMELSSTDLGDGGAKSVVLSRLNLRPYVVIGDGARAIFSFEVLPNQQYPNDQFGTILGQGAYLDQHNRLDRPSGSLAVRESYFRWEQENAEFQFGRVPLQFGKGLYFSSGRDFFDHFSNQWDALVARIQVGHLILQPGFGRLVQQGAEKGNASHDMILSVWYDNPDARAVLGVLYQTRSGHKGYQNGQLIPYGASAIESGWNTNATLLYFSRYWEEVYLEMEAGFEAGQTGLVTAGSESIDLGGYGINVDFGYQGPGSDWSYLLRAGIASGDDPNTARYEGFQWNRNFDVAFILANHPVGQYDVLRSGRRRNFNYNNTPPVPYPVVQALDEESVSNMFYLAPQITKSINRQWKWKHRLVWAQAHVTPSLQPNTSRDLGFEYDVGLEYWSSQRWLWLMELGIFAPGSAFKGGDSNYPNQLVWGWQVKSSYQF